MLIPFLERKITYSGEEKQFQCSLLKQDDEGIVLAYKPDQPMELSRIRFDSHGISFGYYWPGKNYNVYHWKNKEGNTLFTYFNLSKETRIGRDYVRWVDLIVDIGLKPNGIVEVLDEHEIPLDIDPKDLEIVRRTQPEILGNIKRISRYLEVESEKLLSEWRTELF